MHQAVKTAIHNRVFRRFCLVTGDMLLCTAAYLWAFLLRFVPDPIPAAEEQAMWELLPVLLGLRLASLVWFDMYRLSWRYVGLPDLMRLFKASTASSLLFALLVLTRDTGFPRSVLVMDWLLVVVLLGSERLALREATTRVVRSLSLTPGSPRRKVLILGVNDLAVSLARDLARRSGAGYSLVGFLTDEAQAHGHTIYGQPVFGDLTQVAPVVVEHQVDEVIIALSHASGNDIHRIIQLCEKLPVQLRILHDPWDGHRQVALAQVRDVRPEDLLRRPPVRVDPKETGNYVEGEVVLVTGAGGSIGSELVRQLLTLKPRQILLLGHGEHSVFQIHQELQQEHGVTAVPLIGDVCDRRRLEQIFGKYRPTVVFHAAAHKHVPLMESNPTEAIKNNVLGTRNLLWVSERFDIKTFVLISTDKAVNPTSVMGATKRVAEMMLQAQGQRCSGRYMAVRFGNVLGSRGSVVPVIQRQILRNLPVTITHPEMVRFFMTIPEAVTLVLQAGALGNSGQVFVLDMGEPVRIVDLARDLVRLCGLVPDRDVRFRFTGIRPGEKLYEEVLTAEEGVVVTKYDRIRAAPLAQINERWLHSRVDALAQAAAEGDEEEIRQLLAEVVQTYRPSGLPAVASRVDAESRETESEEPAPARASGHAVRENGHRALEAATEGIRL